MTSSVTPTPDAAAVDAVMRDILGDYEADPLHVALRECSILKDRVSTLSSELKEKQTAVEELQRELLQREQELTSTQQSLSEATQLAQEAQQLQQESDQRHLRQVEKLRTLRSLYENLPDDITGDSTAAAAVDDTQVEMLSEEQSLLNSNDASTLKERLRSLHRDHHYSTQEHALELQMEKDNFRQMLRDLTQEYETKLAQSRADVQDRENMILTLQEEMRKLQEICEERDVQQRTCDDYRILENAYLRLAEELKQQTVELEIIRTKSKSDGRQQQQQHYQDQDQDQEQSPQRW